MFYKHGNRSSFHTNLLADEPVAPSQRLFAAPASCAKPTGAVSAPHSVPMLRHCTACSQAVWQGGGRRACSAPEAAPATVAAPPPCRRASAPRWPARPAPSAAQGRPGGPGSRRCPHQTRRCPRRRALCRRAGCLMRPATAARDAAAERARLGAPGGGRRRCSKAHIDTLQNRRWAAARLQARQCRQHGSRRVRAMRSVMRRQRLQEACRQLAPVRARILMVRHLRDTSRPDSPCSTDHAAA